MKASGANNFLYNKRLKPPAHKLRYEMTKAEACLWKYALRAGMMQGYTFRRQRPVLNYIADFLCKELLLIIEVDGLTHQWDETVAKDNKKAADLEAAGFKVIRFQDVEVLNHMEIVKNRIAEEIYELEQNR